MTFANLIKAKKGSSVQLVEKYSFPKTNKAIGLVKIWNPKVLKKLIKWFQDLQVNFIIITDEKYSTDAKNIAFTSDESFIDAGLDFVICDTGTDCINKCFEHGIAPIIVKDSNVSSLLSEFNPMKSEWNAYLYDTVNEWSIFATLIRYLENYKFTFDNKNLVKNIFES